MPQNKEEHDRIFMGLIRQRRMASEGCRRIVASRSSLSTLPCWALSIQLCFSSFQFFFLPPTHSVIFCQWQALESSSLRPPSDRCLGCSSAVYRKYLNYSSHKGWALCIFFPSQLRNRKPCSIVACPRVMLIALSWLVFFRTMEINLM